MSEITVNINGKNCNAKEGEFILNIARRNDIYIPAICYLTECSPTLACRLCLVEADGKRVYSCNAKAKDGMQIITENEEIAKERRAVMEVYDVNHPLQCGVCDQSGECELQNNTLYMGVDSQSYAIVDCDRSLRKWGLIDYDPSLCIVCERCVTVCKDMIGDSALKTIPRGGEPLDKGYKEKMPKDAYAMWNKLQKSIIGTVSGESLDCTFCGECISVCPVGALTSSDFKYNANAWELKRIPASNPHSSDCSQIFYELRHESIKNPKDKIFRVTNEFHYSKINGAARFGFDFANENVKKDKVAFKKALEAFKKADTIKFDSFITNEEALILQKLKDKFGFKLINKNTKAFQKFLNEFAKESGLSLYNGDLKTVKESNFIISVGSALKTDSPNSGFAFNNALTMNKGAGIYFHPVGDPIVQGYSKNILQIENKIGSEEAILYLILDKFCDKEKLPNEILDILSSFHKAEKKTVIKKLDEKDMEEIVEVDKNILYDKIGIGDEFDAKLTKFLAKKDKFSLILGEDLYSHKESKNIALIAGLIEKYSDFKVVIIPPQTNSLGVSLICDLDDKEGDYTIGYNVQGDFTLSALGDGDLDMPALNQQEGTFTNIDKRVVPTNAALSYGGYTLNDIANALGLKAEFTIDYTKQLPKNRGFKDIAFDDLPNHFDNSGNEHRGYKLTNITKRTKQRVPKELEEIESFDGVVVYRCDPVLQFSKFTNKCKQLNEKGALFVSNGFLENNDFSENDIVEISNDNGEKLETVIRIDNKINGNIPYLPTFDKNLDSEILFEGGYRYAKVKIQRCKS